MSLHVLDSGLATRVVDFGRPASRSLGVPVGGAADRAALALGNALAGNAAPTPALEICLKGPVLRAEAQVAGVLFGAPFSITSSRQTLKAGTTFTMSAGEELRIGGAADGLCAYLCIRGGLQVPKILESSSALEPIKPGDTIPCPAGSLGRRFFPPEVSDELREGRHFLRTLPGLQAASFDEAAFYAEEFVVTPAMDRMGIRLEGGAFDLPPGELVSEPVSPGTVQVTGNGQCIVLGVDGQTIGGYPKIAQVIQADQDHLAQLRPGDRLRFRKVTLVEATGFYRQRQAFIETWGRRALNSLDGC